MTPNEIDEADRLIERSVGPAVTRPGDVWRVGEHRLICGDVTKRETYQALLADKRAQMIFSDPPTMCLSQGAWRGTGKFSIGKFAIP